VRGTVVLFNRDLRLRDHPALHQAVAGSDRVIPLFVLDPQLVADSPNRTRFLLDCLGDLGTRRLQLVHANRPLNPQRSHRDGVEQLQGLVNHLMQPWRWCRRPGLTHLVFEEGTQAAWLYDLIKPLVYRVVVCDPRRNRLLQDGSKNDDIDEAKLAELLRLGSLKPVYQGEKSLWPLKHLVRNYDCLTGDVVRVKNRIKAVFRSRAIPYTRKGVYEISAREHWLHKISEPTLRTTMKYLFEQLDLLNNQRRPAQKEMVAEGRKHQGFRILQQVPGLGRIRTCYIVAIVGTPFRFRTKRQYCCYCGFAVITKSTSDYEIVNGTAKRKRKKISTRGLNPNCNHKLKNVYKGAVRTAKKHPAFANYYAGLDMRSEHADLTLARKLAAISLVLWKKGKSFDPAEVCGKKNDSRRA
jgi:transposase